MLTTTATAIVIQMNEEQKQQLIAKIRVKEEIKKRKIKNNLTEYTKFVHRGNWIPAKHLVFIQDKAQQLIDGKLSDKNGDEVDILMLSMPPQHGKSQSITETLPSYMACKHDDYKVIIAGYSATLAQTFNRRNRQKIQEFAGDLFNVRLTKENAGMLELSNGSVIQADGLLGGITGNPADLIIVDDVIKNRQEADSENQRSTIWKEFRDSVRTRLSARGKVIIIMTRWHEDDLFGRIENFDGLPSYSINLPVEAEENDIIGREVGDALFPEIGKDKEWVAKFRESYVQDPYEGGKRSWNALYLGRPSEREGNIFKRENWGRYKWRMSFIKTLPILILSVDASFKGGENNDKVSIQVWGKKGANVYLVDNETDQMGFTETKQTIKDMIAKYPRIGARYVEDKANGSAIIEVLNKEMGGFIPIKADVSTGGKVARAYAIQPFAESGNIYIPEDVPWAIDFINECSEFPNGAYKDQVDSFTQAVNKLMYAYAENTADSVSYGEFFKKDKKDGGEKFPTSELDIGEEFMNYGN